MEVILRWGLGEGVSTCHLPRKQFRSGMSLRGTSVKGLPLTICPRIDRYPGEVRVGG